MIKEDIGINAGYIWRLLDEKGALCIDEISEYTDFKLIYIYSALGWLARENKINFFERSDNLYIELMNYPEIYF